MPNLKANSLNTTVVGVDGCKAGWIAAIRRFNQPEITWIVCATWQEFLAKVGPSTSCIAVDMPIGLVDRGRRCCDLLARKQLTGGRASSVFAPPRRPMLEFRSYEAANEWGKTQGPRAECGGGLSKQAWNITNKIREIDNAIAPRDQEFIIEAHPELAFRNLAADHQLPPKTSEDGIAVRMEIISSNGLTLSQAKDNELAGTKLDDLLDAAVLSLVAERKIKGEAVCLPSSPQLDSRGLRMEIWY